MPVTITDVALNFRMVCEYAKKKQKTELAILVETTTKTVNFVFGLERPIEQLAYAGEDDAVEFLLLEFNGHLGSAARGYARANNNSSAVERLIRSGADINYAVMGYAIAGNIAAVDDLLRCRADNSWAMRGYAQAGNVNLVNSMLLADSDDSDFENSPWLQDAFLGFACGGHVAAVNNLFRRLQSHSSSSGATIVKGYAWVNNQDELARWRDLDAINLYREGAMDGYANGGHFTELEALSNAMPYQVLALIGRLESLSSSEHILQVNGIINASIALGYPIFNLIHKIFTGYARAGNFEEINKLCAQFNLDNSDAIKAHVNNMNYHMLQIIYEQNSTEETLNEITKAVWQQDPHFFPDLFQVCTDKILFNLTSITNDILRNAIIDTIFDEVTRPTIYEQAKKISDSMQKGLCYEEAKKGKLSHFMDNYHFNANQARMFLSKEINVFVFFLQIVPAITNQLTDPNLIWLIASYLLPNTWDAKLLADNKRLYNPSIMQPNDMLDISNKISVYRMFKLPSVVKNSDKIYKNTHSDAPCTFPDFTEEASTNFNVTANGNNKRQKR